ncbi:MAG: Eco57I restriction-modification methylase domain-containing protein [Candidatus Helarchaeota archaeon]|nr:Eco57I restriction-modification methylase domain-containing protein [Candidatus Helarchaeota archaeon]
MPNPFFDPKSDDGLLGFLNNYNFTIEEDTPLDIEVALDPEMLGKIFENLLEEDERKKSGTYYTPRPVVHFICQTTLIEQLYERTDISKDLLKDLFNETTLEAFFDKKEKLTPKKARKIDDELSEIKILDPAVGSGAFLIAMLQNLMFARRRCKKVLGESVTRGTTVFSQWKLEFIKRCLYGVDIKPEAIEIAKLRFWLSLVVDMEREHVQPLPNLDYNLMVGDSLIEELSGEGFFTESELSARTLTNDEDELLTRYQILFKKLREIKNDYFDAPINDHPKLRENILELEKEILSLNYHNQQKLLNNELKKKTELLEKKRVYLKEQSQIQKTLIPPKQKGTQKKLITFSKIKKEISNIEKSIKILNKKLKYNEEQLDNFENGEYRPFFSYKLHFGDVFQSNGGFDIVIGNPPYGVKVKNNLQKNFGLQSKDTYGVFIIRGLQLLRSGGYLSFITSDTWQTIKSHLLLREFILNNTMVYHLLSMPGWVFGATVNTSILTLKYIPNREKRVEREENIIYLTDFTNIPSQNIDALELILTNLYSNKLKEIAKSIDISIGIYHYKQKLIKKFSNLPFFIASPKIFQITNDVDSPIEKIKRNEETYELRKIKIDNEFIRVFTFGNIAIIKKGIDTGENKIFLFQIEGVYGNYRIIDFHEVLSKDEIKSLSDEDKFYGIDPRSHNGKYILPYDKGGESKTENGWLPNYYVPTDYFIDWSKTSVNLLKERKKASKHKSTIRNKQFWFKEGITFSLTGQYCPTLRFGSGALFDNNGSTIFCKFFHPNLILAVFCSKLGKYIFKNYINHTVHAQVDDFKIFPFIEIPKVEQEKLIKLVNSIKQKQMKNKYYNYFQYEQKEIEEIIDKIYKLNQDDIKEVDSWYERKYPILVDAQKQIEEESK